MTLNSNLSLTFPRFLSTSPPSKPSTIFLLFNHWRNLGGIAIANISGCQVFDSKRSRLAIDNAQPFRHLQIATRSQVDWYETVLTSNDSPNRPSHPNSTHSPYNTQTQETMGCMSSKEDTAKNSESSKTVGGNTSASASDTDKSQPMKKVQTNFSDVNYTDPSTGRRDTVYAPSEIPAQRPSVVSEVPSPPVANGAVSGDGVGNGILGGSVVGVDGDGTREVVEEEGKEEVPWDALSPGSTPRPVA